MLTRSIAGFTVAAVVSSAVAQTTVQTRWLISLDNGTSWQSGAVQAPQTQTNALVQLQTVVLVAGNPVPNSQSPIVIAAQLEAYSTTSTVNGDSMSNPRRFQTPVGSIPLLQPLASSFTRRVGNVLAMDAPNDSTPLGGGGGVVVQNLGNGLQGYIFQNNLPLVQFQLNLDGSLGSRVFSSAFQAYSFGAVTTPAGHVAILQASANAFAPITDIPATLTIIPAPAVLPLLAAGSLLAMRRRR